MEKIFTITLNHSFEDTIDNSLYTTLTEEDAMLLNYDHVQIKLRFTDMDVMYYKAKKEQNNLYKSLIIENDGSSVESEVAFFSPNRLIITTQTLSTGGGGGGGSTKATLDFDLEYADKTQAIDTTNNFLVLPFDSNTTTQIKAFLNGKKNIQVVIKLDYTFDNVPSVVENFEKHTQAYYSRFIENTKGTFTGLTLDYSWVNFDNNILYMSMLSTFDGNGLLINCFVPQFNANYDGILSYIADSSTMQLLQAVFNKVKVSIHLEGDN